jgi:hypothetical protein
MRYSDVNVSFYWNSVFYEALRLYPIVSGPWTAKSIDTKLIDLVSQIMAVPKEAAEDCVFTATRADPNDPTTAQVHVPKGAILGIDIPAVHYNRKLFQLGSRGVMRADHGLDFG